MKFLCSNCKAKYQIPDEKIAGRTLKMDCRRCNTPITIRGDQPQPEELDEPVEPQPRAAAPAASASARSRPGSTSSAGRPAGASSGGSSVGAHPAGAGIAARTTGRSALGADFRRNVGAAGGLAHAAEAPRVTPLDQWHVAINDVPVGPMKRDEIARKIAAGAANADSLAWREGFDDWRPIREIPELAALLRRATQESDRPPAGRPGAPRAPAPRAPAPRPGAMPAPGARSPLGAPAAARASRNNVVPIGGRHGASVAPSYEPDDGDDDDLSGGEGEATTIASAADLGLGDFGKPVRDDGDIPSPHAKDVKPAAKSPTGGFKPIPPPGARPLAGAPASRVAAPAAKPAVAAPVSKPLAPAAKVEPLDDPFGLPPAEPEPKRASFAPPPPTMDAGAPMVSATSPSKPVPVTPQREQRASGGLGVGAMMGIGFAMAAGAVLMYGVVQRFVLAPPPPTTTVVATVATIAPPPASEAQHDAVLDDVPPPSSTVAAPPTTDAVPPPTTTVATSTTPHHTGVTPPPTTGARPPTTRAPAGDDPFAAFADDGAGPAPIATTATPHHDDVSAAHHSSAELTADQINTVRRGGQRALTQCWEGALRTAGHVDGDVRYDIDITIGTSGTVTLVHARGPTVGTLQDCLERAVRRWVFPPSASVTQTAFPIVFSAQQ